MSLQSWSRALKKIIKRGSCCLQDTIAIVLHLSDQGAPELAWLKVSRLQVKLWQITSLQMGKVMTALGLPVTHTSANMVRTKGPLIQEKLAASYCVGGNTLISFFDSKHWHCELYICLIIVTHWAVIQLYFFISLSPCRCSLRQLNPYRQGEVVFCCFCFNLSRSINAPRATGSLHGVYQWCMWLCSSQKMSGGVEDDWCRVPLRRLIFGEGICWPCITHLAADPRKASTIFIFAVSFHLAKLHLAGYSSNSFKKILMLLIFFFWGTKRAF